MKITRRGLFRTLAGTAAAVAYDPERALWVPGQRLISIPAQSVNAVGRIFQGSDIGLPPGTYWLGLCNT